MNEKKNGVRIKKVKSFNSNKTQFEDLSQFVLSAQNKFSNNLPNLNSILKRDDSKNSDSVDFSGNSSVDKRKRVSIGTEYHLYGKFFERK